jgi:hypothetical protein
LLPFASIADSSEGASVSDACQGSAPAARNPSNPSNPTNPTNPSNPTNPTNPSNLK